MCSHAAAQQAEQTTVTGQVTRSTIVDSDAIARSRVSTTRALLDQLPAFGSQGVNAAQNDGGFGAYFVDRRNG